MNSKIPFSVDDKSDNPVNLYAAIKKPNGLLAHLYGIPATALVRFVQWYKAYYDL